MRQGKKDGYKEAGHDFNFKPAKDTMRKVKSDFPHMQEENFPKKNHRDAEGHVIIEPRNFVTNNPRKGQIGKG